MNLKKAIQILEDHNRWRRGAEISQLDVYEIGIAIDTVLAEVKNKERAKWESAKQEIKLKSLELCQTCKNNAATSNHGCPYCEEIQEDFGTLCNCCADCQRECRQAI